MDSTRFIDHLISGEYDPKFIEQGSHAWEQIRIGRFTSSEIYKIMECGKRQMNDQELKARPKTGKGSKTTTVLDPTQMSDKGKKYITQKVWERMTGQLTKSPYAYALAYGKEMEPEAVEHFERVTGMQTEVVGFQPFSDYAGGSPDRYIGDTDILEVKCPVSDEQIDYLMLTDHHDLKRNYPEIYWQIVSLLLFCDRQRGHLITYDPRMKEEKHKMTHLVIEREKVQEDIELIPKALEGAVKELLSLMQTVS